MAACLLKSPTKLIMSRCYVIVQIETAIRETAMTIVGDKLGNRDIKLIKEEILGTSSFLVTETEPMTGAFIGGMKLKGNLRVEPKEALRILEKGVKEKCVHPVFCAHAVCHAAAR